MKYAIRVWNDIYPITEEEKQKVVEAMATKSIVVLESGVFQGSYIQAIVRDIHAEKGLNYFYKIQGADGIKARDIKTNLPEDVKKLRKPDNLLE